MKFDVFISHSIEDIDVVKKIYYFLEIKGIRCWIAHKDSCIANHYEETFEAIDNCKVFLFIYSKTSDKSRSVERELNYALRKRKHIIPYIIDRTPMNESVRFVLSYYCWIDACQGFSRETFNILLGHINSAIGLNICYKRSHTPSIENCNENEYTSPCQSRPINTSNKNRSHWINNLLRRTNKTYVPRKKVCNKNNRVSIKENIINFLYLLTPHGRHLTIGSLDPNYCSSAPCEVYSAIYAPAEIKAGDYMIVQVYLYLNEDSGEVELKAKMVDKDATIRNYTPLNIKLKEEDKVDIVLNFYSECIAKQQPKTYVWQGKFTSCEFAVEIPKDINIETLLGQVMIVVNKLPVGEMIFKTTIVHHKPCSLYTEVNAHVFKKIFISYAHQDSSSVKFMARMCEAQGVSYFFDRHKLKAGDVFDEEIFKNIDSSDLFILCWSQNAAKSEYVAKERVRALSLAYPQKQRGEDTIKIYPISIEPRASLPSDMSGIYNFEEI